MRSAMLAVLALPLMLGACDSAPSGQPVDPADPGAEVFPDQPEPAPAGRFAPRNDCVELPGAKLFFVALGKAVKDRDAEALLKLTDPDVKLDFGGGAGLTTFRERLGDEQGKLWEALDELLTLGCAVEDNGDLVLPWHFAQELGAHDPFTSMLAMGADVPVRQSASKKAAVVETIAWDLVERLDGYQPTAEFQKVRTRAGKEGYVESEALRSLLDYRLFASPRADDQWRITGFIAGD